MSDPSELSQEPMIIWSPNHDDQFVVITKTIDLYKVVSPFTSSSNSTCPSKSAVQSQHSSSSSAQVSSNLESTMLSDSGLPPRVWSEFLHDLSVRFPSISPDLSESPPSVCGPKSSCLRLLDSVTIVPHKGQIDTLTSRIDAEGVESAEMTCLVWSPVTSVSWKPKDHIHSDTCRRHCIKDEHTVILGFESGMLLTICLVPNRTVAIPEPLSDDNDDDDQQSHAQSQQYSSQSLSSSQSDSVYDRFVSRQSVNVIQNQVKFGQILTKEGHKTITSVSSNPHVPWLLAVGSENKSRQHFSVSVYDASFDHDHHDTHTHIPLLSSPYNLQTPLASYCHDSVRCLAWLPADPAVIVVGTAFKYMRFYDTRQGLRQYNSGSPLSGTNSPLNGTNTQSSQPWFESSHRRVSQCVSYLDLICPPPHTHTLTQGFITGNLSSNSVKAHDQGVRHVDCDYESRLYIASHGDTAIVKVWDVRALKSGPVCVLNNETGYAFAMQDDAMFNSNNSSENQSNKFPRPKEDYLKEMMVVAKMNYRSTIADVAWKVGVNEMLSKTRKIDGFGVTYASSQSQPSSQSVGSIVIAPATSAVAVGNAIRIPEMIESFLNAGPSCLSLYTHTKEGVTCVDLGPTLAWSRGNHANSNDNHSHDNSHDATAMVTTTTPTSICTDTIPLHPSNSPSTSLASSLVTPSISNDNSIEPWLRFRVPQFKLPPFKPSLASCVGSMCVRVCRDDVFVRGVAVEGVKVCVDNVHSYTPISLAPSVTGLQRSSDNNAKTWGGSLVQLLTDTSHTIQRYQTYADFILSLLNTQPHTHTQSQRGSQSLWNRELSHAVDALPLQKDRLSWAVNQTLMLTSNSNTQSQPSQTNHSSNSMGSAKSTDVLLNEIRGLLSSTGLHTCVADTVVSRAVDGYSLNGTQSLTVINTHRHALRACLLALRCLANVTALCIKWKDTVTETLSLLLKSQLLSKTRDGMIVLRSKPNKSVLDTVKLSVVNKVDLISKISMEMIFNEAKQMPLPPSTSLVSPVVPPSTWLVSSVSVCVLPSSLVPLLDRSVSHIRSLLTHLTQLTAAWTYIHTRIPSPNLTNTTHTHTHSRALLTQTAKLKSWARLCLSFRNPKHALTQTKLDTLPSPLALYRLVSCGAKGLVSLMAVSLTNTHTPIVGPSMQLTQLQPHTQTHTHTHGLKAASLPPAFMSALFPTHIHPLRIPLSCLNPNSVHSSAAHVLASPALVGTVMSDEETWGGWSDSDDCVDSETSLSLYNHAHALMLITVNQLEHRGFFQTAVALALLGGEVSVAISVLTRLQTTLSSTTHSIIKIDLTESNAFNEDDCELTDVTVSWLQEYCRSLSLACTHVSLMLGNLYTQGISLDSSNARSSLSVVQSQLPKTHCQTLSSTLSLLTSSSSSSVSQLCKNTVVPLPIRLFTAATLLTDKDLCVCIDEMSVAVVRESRIADIAVTGLLSEFSACGGCISNNPVVQTACVVINTPQPVPSPLHNSHMSMGTCVCGVCVICLLQLFTDSTADCGSTALIATLTAALSAAVYSKTIAHTHTHSSHALEMSVLIWLATFQDLLNRQRLWVTRSQFDVMRGTLIRALNDTHLHTHTNTTTGAIEGRSRMSISNSSSTLARVASTSSVTSLLSDATNQLTSLPPPPPPPKSSLCGTLVTNTSLKCSNCNCVLTQHENDEALGHASKKHEAESEPCVSLRDRCPKCQRVWPLCVLCLSPINIGTHTADSSVCVTWCVNCHHGGHSSHINEWFESNEECPVTECNCRCKRSSSC